MGGHVLRHHVAVTLHCIRHILDDKMTKADIRTRKGAKTYSDKKRSKDSIWTSKGAKLILAFVPSESKERALRLRLWWSMWLGRCPTIYGTLSSTVGWIPYKNMKQTTACATYPQSPHTKTYVTLTTSAFRRLHAVCKDDGVCLSMFGSVV